MGVAGRIRAVEHFTWERLPVARDRHRGDHPLRVPGGDLDPQPVAELFRHQLRWQLQDSAGEIDIPSASFEED